VGRKNNGLQSFTPENGLFMHILLTIRRYFLPNLILVNRGSRNVRIYWRVFAHKTEDLTVVGNGGKGGGEGGSYKKRCSYVRSP